MDTDSLLPSRSHVSMAIDGRQLRIVGSAAAYSSGQHVTPVEEAANAESSAATLLNAYMSVVALASILVSLAALSWFAAMGDGFFKAAASAGHPQLGLSHPRVTATNSAMILAFTGP